MTLNDVNRKIADALEVFGGHLAIGALLSIITGATVWMLTVEIEQGKQLATLIALAEGRSVDMQGVHQALDKLSDKVNSLELSVVGIKQELNDHERAH